MYVSEAHIDPKSHDEKVLIIDDEIDICFLISSILKQKNISSSFVNTLTAAEKMIESEKPDVVFLDNHLPDGLGVNFIGQIKSKLPGTKVVMISAHDMGSDKRRAYQQGADIFLSKPFTKNMIYAAIG